MDETKDPARLRSHRWFGPDDMRSFGHRSRASQMGYSRSDYMDKPIVAVINTWSDLNQCHANFPQVVEHVKRGIFQAGGFAVELPALSLSEPFVKPTTMLYRNLLAMEVEELLRSHPIDGAVLLGGCDKTTPALLMAAAVTDLPAVFVPAGPMIKGFWRGQALGSGTDQWRYWDERRAGTIGECEWREIEDSINRSPGHCMTMGTASTMTSVAEVLGMTLPGAASVPAVDAAHARLAAEAGRVIIDAIWEERTPSRILTTEAFDDAVATVMALGGSTNAAVHLIAMARRAKVALDLDRFDELSRTVPVIANVAPAGEYLMEDFYRAGGLPALLATIADMLHTDRPTVNGRTMRENLSGAEVLDTSIITPVAEPVASEGSLAVLRGNLAPDGAVIKPASASPDLHDHTGPAVVFDSYDAMLRRLETDTSITPDHVLVLRNGGPVGGPGMPEWGMLPIPGHLIRAGVRDMVRISDARMSGTSYGTCVLHVAPESAVGGPLALVQDGDLIRLNVPDRRLDMLVDDAEIERRRAQWVAPERTLTRGYGRLFVEHIGQANDGCDFDFLEAGDELPEPEIH